MRIILETDEAWSIMMLVTAQVVDGVQLSEKGRAAIRRWRSDHADGSEPMHQLAEEMNEIIGNALDDQTRKLVRTKGRIVRSP